MCKATAENGAFAGFVVFTIIIAGVSVGIDQEVRGGGGGRERERRVCRRPSITSFGGAVVSRGLLCPGLRARVRPPRAAPPRPASPRLTCSPHLPPPHLTSSSRPWPWSVTPFYIPGYSPIIHVHSARFSRNHTCSTPISPYPTPTATPTQVRDAPAMDAPKDINVSATLECDPRVRP